MKRGFLISLLMLTALSLSASVRVMVPQAALSTRADEEPAMIPMDTEAIADALQPAASAESSSSSSRAVAPYKRVEALLPIVRDPTISDAHQRLANNVFRTMIPSRCLPYLKNFYMTTGMKSRGYAGEDTIIVDASLNDEELTAILFHETTHFLDLSGCITGTQESGASAFKDGTTVIYNDDPSVAFYSLGFAAANIQKKGVSNTDFVTGYAKTNCFEDLAETVTYYIVHQDDFRARAAKSRILAKKLEWIETYVFPGGRVIAKQEGPAFTKIPWDATKLAYSWKLNDVAAR